MAEGTGRRARKKPGPPKILSCQLDGQPIPLTVSFVAYACHHQVCRRCLPAAEWQLPAPWCPSCRPT